MSEYLIKKAVLEWLKKRLDETQFVREAHALAEVVAKIECGRFDADKTEVQRLRAALERIRKITKESREAKYHVDNYLLIEMVAEQALSTTTEPTGPYTVRRDVAAGINAKGHPFAVAIERNGYTVLHLKPGTERNEEEVEHIVDLLNNRSPEQHLIWEIKGLLETWDFRAIAAELESGYEQGVLVELVELCEKLTGAKSPRVNELKGDGNDV